MALKIAAATLITTLALAPAAQADSGDYMYRVGTEIPPGEYTYTVVGDGGSWKICSTANCSLDDDGIIDMDMVDGAGHTGYFSVPRTAKYVKITNLAVKAA